MVSSGRSVAGSAGKTNRAVDPEAQLVRVGPGCLLSDVDQATQEHALATVLGFISESVSPA